MALMISTLHQIIRRASAAFTRKFVTGALSALPRTFEFVVSRPWYGSRELEGPKSGIVLCELHKIRSLHVAYYYFLDALWKVQGGFEVVGFTSRGAQVRPDESGDLRDVRLLGSFKGRKMYEAMRINQFFPAQNVSEARLVEAVALVQAFYEHPSLNALERLEVDGVLVGDLIYDEFLRLNNLPTIDLETLEFRDFLLSAISRVLGWFEFFKRHQVVGVISTDVYMQMVPGRIALSKGIDSFVVDWASSHTYRLSSNRPRTRDQYREYPQLFAKLPDSEKICGLERASSALGTRLRGAENDPLIPNLSAWGSNGEVPRQLSWSKGLKILIAAHDFSDSPHNSIHFYPDFFRWLEFLMSKATDSRHDWYIKTHKDASEAQVRIVRELVRQYPSVKLIDPNTSHSQLIQEGVSLALTVLGTIGVEYAWMGLPVINATTQHTHMGYGFNINPNSREEYEKLLSELEAVDSLDHEIEKTSVAEYFFMHRFYNRFSLFFKWPRHPESLIIHTLQRLMTPRKVRELYTEVYGRFILSREYWMNTEDSSIITKGEKSLIDQHTI
jgi:hypothetical protein